MPFIELGKFPFLTGLLSVFTVERCWMLLNALSVSFEPDDYGVFVFYLCRCFILCRSLFHLVLHLLFDVLLELLRETGET